MLLIVNYLFQLLSILFNKLIIINMKKLLFIISAFILLSSCVNNKSKEKSPENESPCSLVTEAEIKEILSIPQDAVTTMEDVDYTYPTCSYEWETLIYVKKMTMSGQDLELEYPYSLMIVLVDNADDAMFEQSTVVYKDGEKLSGLGDMATWGDSMSQLTFLSGGKMIHLNLKTSDNANENKEKAIKLAKLIEKRL